MESIGSMIAIKKNLHDFILEPFHASEIMLCPDCGNEYSANKGDYWNAPEDYVFTCDNCNTKLRLVTKETIYKNVKKI